MINGKIGSGQIFIFLFVSFFTNLITAPFLINEDGALWSAFLPLIMQGILYFLILIPTILYSRTEEKAFPEWLIAAVKLLYGVYFLYLTICTLISLADFSDDLSGSLVNKYIIAAAALVGAFYAAYQGIEAIMRFSAVIFAALIISSVFLICFTINIYDPTMLKPFSDADKSDLLKNTFSMLSLSPHLAAVFLLGRNIRGSICKSALIWSVLSIAFFCGMFILICGSSGEYLRGMKYPLIHSIDASGTLQRFDPIFLGTAVSCVFCTLSFSLCIAKDCFGRIAEKNTAGRFAFPAAVFLTGAVSFAVGSNDYAVKLLRSLSAPLDIVFAFIIPLLSVAAAFIRSLSKNSRRKLKKVSAALSVVLICSIIASGCGGVQLNKQLIIQGMAVDHSSDGYTLTCIVLDTKTEQSDNAVKIIRSQGSSIEQAVSELEAERGSKAMLSQCLFLLMDTEAADRSAEMIGYLSGNRQVMKSLNILTVGEKAGELLEKAVTDLGYDSETVNMLTASDAVNTHTVRCSLFDYISASKKSCTGIVLPMIVYDSKTSALKTDGSVVLDENGKIVSTLDNNETLSVMLLKNSGNIFFYEYEDDAYELTLADSSVETYSENSDPHIDISIRYHSDVPDKKKAELKELLRETLSDVFDKTMKNGCDILGIIEDDPDMQSMKKAELDRSLRKLRCDIKLDEY